MNIFNRKTIFLSVLCGLFTLQTSMVNATKDPKKQSKKIAKIACVFTIGSLLAAAAWYHKEYLGALTTHFIGKNAPSHEELAVFPLPKIELPDMTGIKLISETSETDFPNSFSLKYYNSLEALEATLIAFAKSLAHQVNEQLNSVCQEL